MTDKLPGDKPTTTSPPAVPGKIDYAADKKIVVAIATGRFNLDDVKTQTHEVVRLMNQRSVKNVLVDCSNAHAEVSMADIYWLPTFYAQLGAPRLGRVAVIVPADKFQIESYQFYELICQNSFYNVRLFETREAAEAWLENSTRAK